MRKSRFTETQIIGVIKEKEAGLAVAETCRKHGIGPASFYKLKAKLAHTHAAAPPHKARQNRIKGKATAGNPQPTPL